MFEPKSKDAREEIGHEQMLGRNSIMFEKPYQIKINYLLILA